MDTRDKFRYKIVKIELSNENVKLAPRSFSPCFNISLSLRWCLSGEIFGQWVSDWQYTWEELKDEPTMHDHTIKILLKEPKKKKLGLFGGGSAGKSVQAPDKASTEWVMNHILQAYNTWRTQ